MNGQFMAAEIAEQPEMFTRIVSQGWRNIESIAATVRRRAPRFVLLAARGTSDNAALYAKYLFETRLGIPAGLISPSTFTVYGARPNLKDVLFMAVSQSGLSPDLVEPLILAREAGAVTVAVVNDPRSPLAAAAEHVLDVLAGTERAVAATKTYTAQLLTLFLLVEALAQRTGEAAHPLGDMADRVLSRGQEVKDLAVRYRFADQLVVTSRGYNYPTAREAALKLMETSYLVAHAFSGADLLHGPMAMIRRGFPVISIVPPGAGGEALRPVLDRLQEQRADIWIVGGAGAGQRGTVAFDLGETIDEVLSPLLLILPLQQFAWCLALGRGGDPDEPAGLQKVTQTR